MRGMRGWNRNMGDGYAGNLGGNAENAQNQCGDEGNQGGNLGIAVEMTQNSSGNDKSGEKS